MASSKSGDDFQAMNKRKEQARDIWLYYRFIRKCRNHPWTFSTPIRYIERVFVPRHRTLRIGAYFDAVMSRLGVTPEHALAYYREELMADRVLKNAFVQGAESNKDVQFDKIYGRLFKREHYVTNYYALMETVARLQSVLLGDQLSFVGEAWQNAILTFESATTVGQKQRLANLDLV